MLGKGVAGRSAVSCEVEGDVEDASTGGDDERGAGDAEEEDAVLEPQLAVVNETELLIGVNDADSNDGKEAEALEGVALEDASVLLAAEGHGGEDGGEDGGVDVTVVLRTGQSRPSLLLATVAMTDVRVACMRSVVVAKLVVLDHRGDDDDGADSHDPVPDGRPDVPTDSGTDEATSDESEGVGDALWQVSGAVADAARAVGDPVDEAVAEAVS